MKAEAPTQVWPHLDVIHLGASLAGKGLLGFAVELVLFALRAGGNVQFSSTPEGREIRGSEQRVPPKALPMAKWMRDLGSTSGTGGLEWDMAIAEPGGPATLCFLPMTPGILQDGWTSL